MMYEIYKAIVERERIALRATDEPKKMIVCGQLQFIALKSRLTNVYQREKNGDGSHKIYSIVDLLNGPFGRSTRERYDLLVPLLCELHLSFFHSSHPLFSSYLSSSFPLGSSRAT